jgi:Protein of unknown function (DUF2851)
MLCEINASAFPDEEAVARRWWSLPPRSLLPLSNGDAYQLLFAGRPGGAAGPDVRDAVLCDAHPRPPLLAHDIRNVTHARRYVGDVEFHIRSSDWVVHRHHSDPRYNNVILHVVLLCDDSASTTRQDGLHVPVCSLYDLPTGINASLLSSQDKTSWPCHYALQHISPEERDRLLEHAGLLRFEQKAHAFVEQLHASTAAPPYDLHATCLLPALAEGLGYGRDRAFFRALGQRLLGKGERLPEPLGRAAAPAPLDAGRMRSLHLLARRGPDLWQRLRSIITSAHLPADGQTALPTLSALRAVFCETGLSVARTDILICNIVLPFAAAVALLERDLLLNEQAQALYRMHPGLPSNSVTRMMSAQLKLASEPSGSCRQQGLHYVYRETCQEKRCEVCMLGSRLSL